VVRGREGLYEAALCLVPAPGVDVVVAKWRLGGADGSGGSSGAGGVDGAGDDVGGHGGTLTDADATAVPVPVPDPDLVKACAAKPGFQWRWRVLSVKLLPALDATVTRVSPGALVALGQQMEERLWAAADHQVLEALGLGGEGEREREGGKVAVAVGEDTVMPDADVGDGTGAMRILPPTDLSALALVDGRMRAISSHVLIGAVVADAARDLERGTWKGAIKVGKPVGASGILIDLWWGVPVVSKEEASVLSTSDVFEPEREIDPRPHYASFEVLLDADGTLTPRAAPDTIHIGDEDEDEDEGGDDIVASLCASDSGDGSNNLERVLLRLTADLASSQLECVRESMQRQLNDGLGNLIVHSSIVYRPGDRRAGVEAPRIDVVSSGESVLSVTTNLKTGIPSFLLGPSVAEDGLVCQGALSIVRSANALLKEEIRGLKTRVLPKNASASMYFCSMVAKSALVLVSELVSFVSVGHLLAASPFEALEACETPGMLLSANRVVSCYTRGGNGSDPVGYLVLETEFGAIGLQRAKYVVYDARMLQELRVVEEVEGWDEVLKEAAAGGQGLRGTLSDGAAAALRRVERSVVLE